jgi:hypothetical protein
MSEFELGLLRLRGAGGAAAKDFAQRGVDRSADRLRAHRDQRDREDAGSAGAGAIAEVFLQFWRLGSVRPVLLWYRQEKVPLCSYRRDAHGPGSALGRAGLQPYPGDFEEPGLRRCVCLRPDFHPFAYHRRSLGQNSRQRRANGAMGWNDKLLVQHRVDK